MVVAKDSLNFMSFSRYPFAEVCRTFLVLDAIRLAVLERTNSISVHENLGM
jgi:hypothetical protein